jgi:hypothetical protein
MQDIVTKVILDDSEFVKSMDNLGNLMQKTGDDFKKFAKDNDAALNAAAKKMVKDNADIEKSIIKTSRSMREARVDLKNQIQDYSFFGVSIRDVKEKISEFTGILKTSREAFIGNINPTKVQAEGIQTLVKAFGGGQTAILGLVKGFNILRGAILATGIGALILGLSGLVAWLTKSQSGMDFVGQKMAYVGGVTENLKKKLVSVGTGIIDSFSNGTVIKDFGALLDSQINNRLEGLKKIFTSFSTGSFLGGLKQAASGLQEVVTGIKTDTILGIGKEANLSGVAMENLEKKMQGVKKAQKEVEVQTALNRSEIEKYKKIGDDTTKSFTEREEAIRKAASLELSSLKQNELLIRQELALTKNKNALSEKTNETLAEEQQLEIKLADVIGNSRGKQSELMERLNSLTKQQIDLINAQKEKLKQLNEELFNQAKAAGLTGQEEEKQFILNKQLDNLDEQKKSYLELGKVLGKDVLPQLKLIDTLIVSAKTEAKKIEPIDLLPQKFDQRIIDIKKQIETLKLNINVDTSKERKKLEDEIDNLLKNPLQLDQPTITINPEYIFIKPTEKDKKSFQDGLNDFLDGVDNFEDLLNKSLDEIFGDEDGKKAKDFLNGLSAGFNEFAGLMNESLQIQISNNDKIIADRQKQRKKVEEELDYEKELNELGLANNLEIKQNEVNALLAEEEKYQKQNDELKQKALKQQLIIDTVAQTQSLITASIQIIKGFSAIPFVGLPLGIAAVASLGAFFAKTKADAFKATKLNAGVRVGESISDYMGVVDRHGSSDKVQEGYKVIRANDGYDTGVRISANEHLWSEKLSLRHNDFLTAMERGFIKDQEIDDFMTTRNFKNSKILKNDSVNYNTYVTHKQNNKQVVQWNENGKTFATIIDTTTLSEGQIINLG